LCGSRHAFMPIVVQAVDLDTNSNWVSAQLVD
jgi:heme/copper-type cytochrome/quinol oxidase subunit 2